MTRLEAAEVELDETILRLENIRATGEQLILLAEVSARLRIVQNLLELVPRPGESELGNQYREDDSDADL